MHTKYCLGHFYFDPPLIILINCQHYNYYTEYTMKDKIFLATPFMWTGDNEGDGRDSD